MKIPLIHHLLSNSHSRAFINDNNSLLVCHVHDFISVWVMTGSETIGAQPLDKVEVFGNDSIVHSFTTNLQKTLTSQEGMVNIITRIQSNNNVYPKMSIFWCSIVPPSWQIKYRAIQSISAWSLAFSCVQSRLPSCLCVCFSSRWFLFNFFG